jgi:hypothetical protein
VHNTIVFFFPYSLFCLTCRCSKLFFFVCLSHWRCRYIVRVIFCFGWSGFCISQLRLFLWVCICLGFAFIYLFCFILFLCACSLIFYKLFILLLITFFFFVLLIGKLVAVCPFPFLLQTMGGLEVGVLVHGFGFCHLRNQRKWESR